MLQPLAVRREPTAWLNPFEMQDMMDQLRQMLDRLTPVRFPVKAGEGWVFLDVKKVTHFEVVQEVVHVWAGQKFRTPWTTLTEVEAAFPQEAFVRIQRHCLVRPEAIVAFKMTWGGRAEIRMPGGMDLEVSRGAVPKLKTRLGLA